MSSLDGFDVATLSSLVLPSPLYSVVGVAETQDVETDGTPYDALDIWFTVTNRPGVFTVTIPLAGFRVFESGIDLTSEANIVEQLYRL